MSSAVTAVGSTAVTLSIRSERPRVVSPHQCIGSGEELGSRHLLGRAQRIQLSAGALKRRLPLLYAYRHAFPDTWNCFSLKAFSLLPRRAAEQTLGRFPQRMVHFLGQATGKRTPARIGSHPPFSVFHDLEAVFTLTVCGQQSLASRPDRDRSPGVGQHRRAAQGLRKTRQAIADQKRDEPLPYQLQRHFPIYPVVSLIRQATLRVPSARVSTAEEPPRFGEEASYLIPSTSPLSEDSPLRGTSC